MGHKSEWQNTLNFLSFLPQPAPNPSDKGVNSYDILQRGSKIWHKDWSQVNTDPSSWRRALVEFTLTILATQDQPKYEYVRNAQPELFFSLMGHFVQWTWPEFLTSNGETKQQHSAYQLIRCSTALHFLCEQDMYFWHFKTRLLYFHSLPKMCSGWQGSQPLQISR